MVRDSARFESAGAGRPALASFHDEDFRDLKAVVRFLPTLAQEDGFDRAYHFVRTDLRGQVDMLALARLPTKEAQEARSAMAVLFHDASIRLLLDPTEAGDEQRSFVIEVVEVVLYAPSVQAVFERSAPTEVKGYAPSLPTDAD